jgi:protein-export membrane protein SecD
MHPFKRVAFLLGLPLLALGQLSNVHAEGVEFRIEIQTNRVAAGADLAAIQAQSLEVLRRRAEHLGVTSDVQPLAGNQLQLRLFGLSAEDRQCVRRAFERTGFLEFRLVHPDSATLVAQNVGSPGYELMKCESRTGGGEKVVEKVLVKQRAELNGSYLRRAMVTRNQLGEPEIDFELNATGTTIFAQVTRENLGRRLAIVLDDELYSAPVIRGEISGGRGQITGRFDIREALALASLLENPLRAPLKILDEKTVEPAVEREALRSGRNKRLLLVGGALATAGLLAAAVVLVILRLTWRKPPSAPPPLPSNQ